MEENQRLSTIVFGDIKGYTALMQEDEARAMSLLEVFKSGLEDHVPSFGGRIVQYFGDACLLAFESTSQAVRCAIKVQPVFREKGLPVRFGIHLGEVIFTEDNVFGDGVNVASRIESMGVSGGILVSKTVKDQLANKPEFRLKDMGSFDFKNVEEPLQVYAVANDGIVVPRREELQGKFKPTKPRSIFKPVLLAAIVLMLLGLGIWLMRPDKPPLTEAQRNSYLAVLPFENKTGQAGLDAFGNLISDRLTAQLMATGEVKMLPAETLKKEAATAGISSAEIPDFFAGNGIGMIITGRYYTQDDQLLVQLNIVDTETGQVVHAPDPIIRGTDEKSEILEDLSDAVLSFWEVRDQSRFRQNPPRYEAYREFQAGVEDFARAFDSGDENQYRMAEEHFLKAYELDTSFLSPLLRLHVVYHNTDRFHQKDSLFTALEERKNDMTIWERKSYEYEWERNYGSFLEEARIAASMFEMDPSDEVSLTRAYIGYIRGNYPGKAIAFWKKAYPMLMEKMKNRFEPNEWLDLPLYMLREFDSIYTLYNRDVQDVDWDPIMNLIYAQVLVQTGRYKEVEERFLLAPEGGRHGKPVFLYRICNTFLLKGEDSLARAYAGQLKEFALANSDKLNYRRWLGEAEMFMGNYKEAVRHLEAYLDVDWDNIVQSDLIACYAHIGADQKIDRSLMELPQLSKREGYSAYCRARAQTILGNHDQAIEQIASAIQGRVPFDTESYGFDCHFKPLFDDPRFQRLVGPKG